jgi:serine/threonine protein kinase
METLYNNKYKKYEDILIKSYGEIVKVIDTNVNNIYCLKIFNKNSKINSNNEYYNDLEIRKKIKSINFVTLIDYFETKNNFYLITELCDGNLKDLLNEKYHNGMPISLIRKIFSQLNSALFTMYNEKHFHKNLTLKNILYSYINKEKTEFIIKLNDFKLSGEINEENLSNINKTENNYYLSPEVLNGKYHIYSDLWSLGIILYELKNNQYIFTGQNESETLNNKQNCLFNSTGDILLNDLLNQLIVNDPEDRISWEDYFTHPFFEERLYNNINEDKNNKNNIEHSNKNNIEHSNKNNVDSNKEFKKSNSLNQKIKNFFKLPKKELKKSNSIGIPNHQQNEKYSRNLNNKKNLVKSNSIANSKPKSFFSIFDFFKKSKKKEEPVFLLSGIIEGNKTKYKRNKSVKATHNNLLQENIINNINDEIFFGSPEKIILFKKLNIKCFSFDLYNQFTIISSKNKCLLVYKNKKNLEYIDLKKNSIFEIIHVYSENIISIRYFKKNKDNLVLTTSYDNCIKVFNVKDWDILTNIENVGDNKVYNINSALILENIDSNFFIISSNYNDPYLKLFTFKGEFKKKFCNCGNGVVFIDSYKEDKNIYIITCGNIIASFNFENGEIYHKYKEIETTNCLIKNINGIVSLIFAESYGNKIYVYDFHEGTLFNIIKLNKNIQLNCLCFWNYEYLISGGEDNKIHIINYKKNKIIKSLGGHIESVYTVMKYKLDNEEYLISQGEGRDGIRIWK